MKKNYGLTNTELQIMELLWTAQKPMSFREIMNIAVNLRKVFNCIFICFGYILFIKNTIPTIKPIKLDVLIPVTETPKNVNMKILAIDKFFAPENIK